MKTPISARATGLILLTLLGGCAAATAPTIKEDPPASASARGGERLTETKISTVSGKEDWKAQTGFGSGTADAEMMGAMMVEGSGKGSGDMSGMNMGTAPPTPQGNELNLATDVKPDPPVAGDNTVEVVITDAKTGAPVAGLQVTATVAMTAMNMGTSSPTVTDLGSGRYRTTAHFAMAGTWRVNFSIAQAGAIETRSYDYTVQ